MAAHGLDSHRAIQEQLQEQEAALQEIEAALQHDEDADMIEMRDELRGAVQELKTVLENGNSEHLQVEDECDDLPENAADEHAGLGFRDMLSQVKGLIAGSTRLLRDAGPEHRSMDEIGEEEDWEAEDEEAIGRASLAISADAAAREQAAAAGPQTETARFACWEQHTRGVGSKLMAAMGYRAGQGLGLGNSGTVAPVEVLMLRRRAGLGVAALEVRKATKRRRGGAREQRRKATAAADAAREAARDEQNRLGLQEGAPSMFAFINTRLSDSAYSGECFDRHGDNGATYFNHAAKPQSDKKAQPAIQKTLIQHQDACAELQRRLAHLRKIAACNAKDAAFLAQVKSRMVAVQKELERAQAASNKAHQAAHVKGKNDSWAKF